MGYLLHILIALVVQALAESGVSTGWRVPLAPLLLCPAPHLLLALSRRASLAGRFRAAALWQRLLGASGLALHFLALSVFGWLDTLEPLLGRSVGLLGWPHPALLAGLAPFFVYSLLAIDARARLQASRASEIAHSRRFQARMLLSGAAPFFLYVLLVWALGSVRVLRVSIEEVDLWGGVFATGLVLLFVAILPWVLKNTWDTVSFPVGPVRDELEHLAERARFRCRDLLMWRTGHQMANAAVVGVGARQRFVLFSDALLAMLSPRELAAVFAHEMGHVKRRHVLVFLAWALGFFLLADLLATTLAPDDEWVAGGTLLGAALVWYLGFGFLSRRFELDADLFSLELTGDVEAMVGALEQVGSPHSRRSSSWRHFSTEQRVAFLRRVATDPPRALRLRRWVRTCSWLGALVLAVALVGEGVSLAASLPVDRVIVDLRLGRYPSAAARLRGLGELGEPDLDLARKLVLAERLGLDGSESDLERLELHGQASLSAGRIEEARDAVVLALVRGREDLERVERALSELLEGERPRKLERIERTSPAWAPLLRAADPVPPG